MVKQKVEDGGTPRGGYRRGPGRFSARRKHAAVERLIRGEDLELVSRDMGVTAATLSDWRDKFERAGEIALKSRESDERDEEILRLKAKIGELTMTNELLDIKIAKLEETRPFPWRKSKP